MIKQESLLNAVFVAVIYTILSMTDLGKYCYYDAAVYICSFLLTSVIDTVVGYASTVGNNNEFEFMVVNSSSCTCEGHIQVYECRVTGSGTIVWRGTAFDCSSSSNEIVLFQSGSDTVICNNGAIRGRIIRAENNISVSQLTVSVSDEMIGINISCHHDNRGTQNLIGSSLLTLTTGTFILLKYKIYIASGLYM